MKSDITKELAEKFGINNLECIHRHSIKEHPSCFAKGLVKVRKNKPVATAKKATEALIDKGINPWYNNNDFKIGYIDIETDNLKANFGTMLSWAILDRDGDWVSCDVIHKQDLFDGTFDRNLVKSLLKEMEKFNVLVSYYGTGFDIKFIRSKALHYGLDFPEHKDIYHLDLYYRVKSLLCLSSNSLQTATAYLGIPGKTRLDAEVWNKAKYGDKTALEEVLDHNIWDVKILKQLHDKLEKYSGWNKKSV